MLKILIPVMILMGAAYVSYAGCGACGTGGAHDHHEHTHGAKLAVVKFHSDHCGSCKKLAKPFAQLKDNFKDSDVSFITMDFTDEASTEASLKEAHDLGLESLVKANKGSGFILLVDESGHEVGRLKASTPYEEMASLIKAGLKG